MANLGIHIKLDITGKTMFLK